LAFAVHEKSVISKEKQVFKDCPQSWFQEKKVGNGKPISLSVPDTAIPKIRAATSPIKACANACCARGLARAGRKSAKTASVP